MPITYGNNKDKFKAYERLGHRGGITNYDPLLFEDLAVAIMAQAEDARLKTVKEAQSQNREVVEDEDYLGGLKVGDEIKPNEREYDWALRRKLDPVMGFETTRDLPFVEELAKKLITQKRYNDAGHAYSAAGVGIPNTFILEALGALDLHNYKKEKRRKEGPRYLDTSKFKGKEIIRPSEYVQHLEEMSEQRNTPEQEEFQKGMADALEYFLTWKQDEELKKIKRDTDTVLEAYRQGRYVHYDTETRKTYLGDFLEIYDGDIKRALFKYIRPYLEDSEFWDIYERQPKFRMGEDSYRIRGKQIQIPKDPNDPQNLNSLHPYAVIPENPNVWDLAGSIALVLKKQKFVADWWNIYSEEFGRALHLPEKQRTAPKTEEVEEEIKLFVDKFFRQLGRERIVREGE